MHATHTTKHTKNPSSQKSSKGRLQVVATTPERPTAPGRPERPDRRKKSESGGRLRDRIETYTLKSRRILISDGIDSEMAGDVIRKLWFLEHLDSNKPILLVINSPGGSVDAGFAIWDQIKMLKCPVYTLVTGLAASMGSVLSLVAERGKRFATRNARIMIHQPLIAGRMQGQATDLEIQAKEILRTRDDLVKLYSAETGKSAKEIEDALDRDKWLSAEEAIEFGLLDKIVESFQEIPGCCT